MSTPTHIKHSSSPGTSNPKWQVIIKLDPSLHITRGCRGTSRQSRAGCYQVSRGTRACGTHDTYKKTVCSFVLTIAICCCCCCCSRISSRDQVRGHREGSRHPGVEEYTTDKTPRTKKWLHIHIIAETIYDHKPVDPVAYQVIFEPGIRQFREFEFRRVHTCIKSWGLFIVHILTCGKRDSVS